MTQVEAPWYRNSRQNSNPTEIMTDTGAYADVVLGYFGCWDNRFS
jgi:hypothetical protein